MIQKVYGFVGLAILGVAALMGYQLVQSQMQTERYRRQWQETQVQYDKLRDTYNEAVRRTAVTELLVKGGKISVVIRTAEGELKRVETNLDPRREIYVDYVVLGGRIWIRRVFDDRTPPERGVVIDPKLAEVDWSAEHAQQGKAVYRSLGEGRWVITVTGDGSLGLGPAKGEEMPLSPPPEIRTYEPKDQ
ncbi:MAG: hypothetical protein IT440_00750 [Phycisphaeraceae bacterium]|nr:hypothetical protein [Phycisphaeraceae bacterium]